MAVAPKPSHRGVPYPQHDPPAFVTKPLPFLKYTQNLKPQHNLTPKEHFSHVPLLSDLDSSNFCGYVDYLSTNHVALNASRKPLKALKPCNIAKQKCHHRGQATIFTELN